jgi:hypothetical protein
MIALADSFTPQYPSEKALVGAIVGKLKIEARERGWKGTKLLEAEWIDRKRQAERGYVSGGDPIALVVIGPGHGDVTVDEVSAFIRDKRKRGKS